MSETTITLDVTDAKAAKKALNAAVRAQRKQAGIDRQSSDLAMLRARANGWNILHRKASGETFPHGWRLYRPGQKYANTLLFPDRDNDHKTKVSTCDGYASVDTYCNEIISCVTDGSGWIVAVFIREMRYTNSLGSGYYPDPDGRVVAWAIGVADGQYGLAELPGVTQDEFIASTRD